MLPPLPIAVESNAHWITAGGRATTETRVESRKMAAESASVSTAYVAAPTCSPVTTPAWSTEATTGSRVSHPKVFPGIA